MRTVLATENGRLPKEQLEARVCGNCAHACNAATAIGRLYAILQHQTQQLQTLISSVPKVIYRADKGSTVPLSPELVEALRSLFKVETWTVRCEHENIRIGLLNEACYAWKPREIPENPSQFSPGSHPQPKPDGDVYR